MAEGDRDMHRRQLSEYEKEKEIMKDIPGWKVSQVDCFWGDTERTVTQIGESVYANAKYQTREIVLK